MKTLNTLLAVSLIGLGLIHNAAAQGNFPSKPIRIVVGFPADGPLDQHARLLTDKLPYSTLKDFVPIARTAMQALALLVNTNVKAQTLPKFVSYAKANPGKVNYGSAGNGDISHLVPEMFKSATGLFTVHIPYRSSAPAFLGAEEFAQFLSAEMPKWATAVQKSGAKLD
jgi:tripartite-type tricarboxylate transporter receptor subunit TctC